jgi:adenine-specific DNA methylase
MNEEGRASATKQIISSYAFLMAMMFFSTITSSATIIHMVLGIVMTVFAFTAVGMVWNWGTLPRVESDSSKGKNDTKLEKMLNRLSDEELDALREKLSHRNESYYLDNDGEIARR